MKKTPAVSSCCCAQVRQLQAKLKHERRMHREWKREADNLVIRLTELRDSNRRLQAQANRPTFVVPPALPDTKTKAEKLSTAWRQIVRDEAVQHYLDRTGAVTVQDVIRLDYDEALDVSHIGSARLRDAQRDLMVFAY